MPDNPEWNYRMALELDTCAHGSDPSMNIQTWVHPKKGCRKMKRLPADSRHTKEQGRYMDALPPGLQFGFLDQFAIPDD
jgi:hypothetical protein